MRLPSFLGESPVLAPSNHTDHLSTWTFLTLSTTMLEGYSVIGWHIWTGWKKQQHLTEMSGCHLILKSPNQCSLGNKTIALDLTYREIQVSITCVIVFGRDWCLCNIQQCRSIEWQDINFICCWYDLYICWYLICHPCSWHEFEKSIFSSLLHYKKKHRLIWHEKNLFNNQMLSTYFSK